MKTYKATTLACYLGYIVQAIVLNLAPLLFVCFQNDFNIDIAKLTILITITFAIQLVIDLLSTKLVDKIGYRIIAVFAQICSVMGLVSLSILPFIMEDSYIGIVISVLIASLGSGLCEVVVSPIVEAIPTNKSNRAMNFLHSFYCWGYVFVVVLVTIYLSTFGIANWRWLPSILSIFPFVCGILFLFVPINVLVEKEEDRMSIKDLLTNKTFLLIFLMMLCSGAAEQSISQWASLFAEKGLNISKTMGDLIGPCLFAFLMGISRVVTGIYSDKVDQTKILIFGSIGCICSYVLIIISISPILSLVGCALCGVFSGAMWPGCLNLSARTFKNGGTTMFAIAALGGDLGCMMGPTLVGWVSDAVSNDANSLIYGIAASIIFPIILFVGLVVIKIIQNKEKSKLLK